MTCSSDTDELLALALGGRDRIDESLGGLPLLIDLAFRIGLTLSLAWAGQDSRFHGTCTVELCSTYIRDWALFH